MIVDRTGQVYRLSADTILYAVLLNKGTGIYGVPDVISGLTASGFAELARKAQDDLMEQKAGELDFDGNFVLMADFGNILKYCTDCKNILGVDMKRGKQKSHMSCFIEHSGVVILKMVKENLFSMARVENAVDELLRFIDGSSIGWQNKGGVYVSVDSRFVIRKDRRGMLDAGANQAVADLVIGAMKGQNSVFTLSKIRKDKYVDSATYLFNEDMLMEAAVEYEGSAEILKFTSVTGGELVKKAQTFLEV